jgi:uncharacterized membrane protein YgcG
MRDPLRDRIINDQIQRYEESLVPVKTSILRSIFSILLAVVSFSIPLLFIGIKMALLEVNGLLIYWTLVFFFFGSVGVMAYLPKKFSMWGTLVIGPLLPFTVIWSILHFSKFSNSSELPYAMKFIINCAVVFTGFLTHLFLPQLRVRLPRISRVLYWNAKWDYKVSDVVASPLILFLAGIGIRELLEARGFSLLQAEMVILAVTCLSVYIFIVSLSWNAAKNQIITAIPSTILAIYLLLFFEPGSIDSVVIFFEPVHAFFVLVGMLSGCMMVLGGFGSSGGSKESSNGGGGGFSGGGASGKW